MKQHVMYVLLVVGLLLSSVSCVSANKSSLSAAQPSEPLGTGAKTRQAICLLEVNGHKYIDGLCKYAEEKDGSFRLFAKQYFVYVNVIAKGKAGAFWNADPQSTHAQAPLGDVQRQGACWTNKATKICAWEPSADTEQEPQRIQFAQGAISAIVDGRLNGFEQEDHYVLSVT